MDDQETKVYTAIIVTAVVLGIIIAYFTFSIIRQQRRNLQLHKQNILAEITALEKDRARIAADLHDELGPMLSAVKMKINSFELTESDDRIQIEKTNHHIDDILKRMREISYDLMPNSLIRKGIVTALNEFIQNLNRDSNINFNFEYVNNFTISEERAINIYRIVQEVIHNALKHSRGTEVNIGLKNEGNKILIRIADNGVGFDYHKELKENTGFGLRSILSRAQIAGGQMFLDSKKGNGTTYIFEIPI